MPGGMRQDYSQVGGHRWRIPILSPNSFRQDGALKAAAEIIGQEVTTIQTGSQAAVTASTLTTLLTFTATEITLIPRIVVSGELPAKVFLILNTITIETRRMTSDRNIEFNFANPLLLEVGDILDVKVQHEFTAETAAYESTLHGIPAVL